MRRCNIEDFFGNKSGGKSVLSRMIGPMTNADVGVVVNDNNASELQELNEVSVNFENVGHATIAYSHVHYNILSRPSSSVLPNLVK